MRVLTPGLRFAMALLAGSSLCGGPAGRVLAQPAPDGASAASITATGSADLVVQPDSAVFVIGVDSEAPSAVAADSANASKRTAVLAALRRAGAGATDLSTIGYSLAPPSQYDSLTGLPGMTDYRVTSSIRVAVARLDHLAAWIDAARSAGATRIGLVQFAVSDLAAVRHRALALALQVAHGDAEALARAAGGSLGALEELDTQPLGPAPTAPITPLPVLRAPPGAERSPAQQPQVRVEARVLGRWVYRAAARSRSGRDGR